MQQKKMYQSYSKTNVQTSDQLSLIIMLYDGTIRFMKKAIVKINQNDIEGAHSYLLRSKDIVGELLSTLKVDAGGDVAKNLRQLYLYCYQKLVEANMTKDPAIIEDVIEVMQTLKQGWTELKEQQSKQNTVQSNRLQTKFRAQG